MIRHRRYSSKNWKTDKILISPFLLIIHFLSIISLNVNYSKLIKYNVLFVDRRRWVGFKGEGGLGLKGYQDIWYVYCINTRLQYIHWLNIKIIVNLSINHSGTLIIICFMNRLQHPRYLFIYVLNKIDGLYVC